MMIYFLENKDTLTVVDWFQIASAIGTVLAAIFALATTLQNRKANKLLDEERHLLVKPSFKVQAIFEQRDVSKIEISTTNLGFNRIMNTIEVAWEGTEGVEVSAKEIINNQTKDINLKILMNYSKCVSKKENIKGKIYLNYLNVLGKSYTEFLEVEIACTYYELLEAYYFELNEGLVGQNFIEEKYTMNKNSSK